jgi:Fe-S cluster assembly protein SufD
VSYPRNLFIAGKNTQASIVERYLNLGQEPSFVNSVTEAVVYENAILNYYLIEREGDNSYHVATTQVNQVEKSFVNCYAVSLSGAMVRNNLNLVLDAEHCESNMYGIYLLNGKTHVDNHTVVDHRKPNSVSNELYKGIMDDNSTGVFNGKIFVRQYAQKTNAFQSNKNIVMSNNASINTKPQLEIWADDVKCSHGCTTGQLNAEQIFYLQSRGISEQRAKAILLYAFVNDIVSKISLENIRENIQKTITERLHVDLGVN